MTPSRATWIGIGALYVAVWLVNGGLAFPIERDELHFWPTSLGFSHAWLPGLEQLRDYRDLNTPLPFLAWGFLEHLLHGGIAAGRNLNFLLSLVIALLVATGGKGREWHAALAAAGLLIFPYFMGTSTHLYTDIFAALFAVAGVALHLRGRYALAAIAFILGISSRQYAVAFPAALIAYEFFQHRARARPAIAFISLAIALVSLFAWFAFFGGFGPASEIKAQGIRSVSPFVFYPQHSLFFLTTIGMYYVIPELFFYGPGSATLLHRNRVDAVVALLLLAVFALFPPLNNAAITDTFGYTDIGIRKVLPDMLRMTLYFLLAAAAVLRFLREPLALLIVLANAGVLIKAHVGWEKYAVPTLAVLWYLKSRGLISGEPRAQRPALYGGVR